MFAVGCLVPKAQSTRTSLRERSIDGISHFASHPVDLNEKFTVGHNSSEKPGSLDGRVYRSLNRKIQVTVRDSSAVRQEISLHRLPEPLEPTNATVTWATQETSELPGLVVVVNLVSGP